MDMLNQDDLEAFWVTLKLATISTLLLLAIGAPIAWWFATTRSRAKVVLEALVALPLILPPTVLGFYLLLLLGARGPIASWMPQWSLAFTFEGLIVGSVVYSLPFVVQPLQNAFSSVSTKALEAAATLGASPWDRFRSIVVAQSYHGVVIAAILGFAHTVGEFGVVLMLGGNIPGETKVLAIAIYDHVEALEYGQAHLLSGTLLVLSFFLLVVVYSLSRRSYRRTIWG